MGIDWPWETPAGGRLPRGKETAAPTPAYPATTSTFVAAAAFLAAGQVAAAVAAVAVALGSR